MRSYTKKIGLAPGTLIHVGEKKSEKTSITTFDCEYNKIEELKNIDDLASIKESNHLHWININGLSETNIIEQIGKIFNFHVLVLEDILHTNQRPKTQYFEDYVFIVLKTLKLNQKNSKISAEQISIILGKNYIITFQENHSDFLHPLINRIKKSTNLLEFKKSDFLAYSIMDFIIDHYFLSLEHISEKMESLEDEVIEDPNPIIISQVHELKHNLIQLRKTTWPLREAINTMIRNKHPLFTLELNPFLHDLYDHTTQLIDNTELIRDIVSGILDIYLSTLNNRMNQIMKTLTIIATIFIPLTFITGIYGMNFKFMPELNWHWGYGMILGIMALITIIMLISFKRKKWF